MPVSAIDRDALRQHIRGIYQAGYVLGESGRRISITPTGVDEVRGEALRELAITVGAVRTLETGLGLGLSTLFLCEAIAASGSEDAHHVTMDPAEDRLWDDAGLRVVRDAGVAELLRFNRLPSSLVLPKLLYDAIQVPEVFEHARKTMRVGVVDLVFIDGDHLFESAFLDIFYSIALVKPGDLIVVDDTWMPAVRLAVDYFVKNMGIERVSWSAAGAKRNVREDLDEKMIILRSPATPDPLWRSWDHFVPFW